MTTSARKPDMASELTRETARYGHTLAEAMTNMARERDLVSEMFVNYLMEGKKEELKQVSEFLEEVQNQVQKKLDDKPVRKKRVVRRRRNT